VVGVFCAGVAIRVVFVALYRPAFLGISDSGSYLFAARHQLFSNVYDLAGYPMFVRLLHALSHLSSVAVAPCARGACVARPVRPSTIDTA